MGSWSISACIEWLRSFIYDKYIISFTSLWYKQVLERIPPNSRVLDVGIGTGTALIKNIDLIRSKNLSIVGVDFDLAYVKTCQNSIVQNNLQNNLSVIHQSIYDYTPFSESPESTETCPGPSPSLSQPPKRDPTLLFDVVYFSGSFMILPDQPAAIRHIITLMKDSGRGGFYFTQTFEEKRNKFLEWLKPRMSYFTSIDFGNVTYLQDFKHVLQESRLDIKENSIIQDGKYKPGVRGSYLVYATPKSD